MDPNTADQIFTQRRREQVMRVLAANLLQLDRNAAQLERCARHLKRWGWVPGRWNREVMVAMLELKRRDDDLRASHERLRALLLDLGIL